VYAIGHEMLHRGERSTLTTKQTRNRTEHVAFVVCQSVGLQTGTASADCIQLWHGDAKLLQEESGSLRVGSSFDNSTMCLYWVAAGLEEAHSRMEMLADKS
jgi:hypothetical protein